MSWLILDASSKFFLCSKGECDASFVAWGLGDLEFGETWPENIYFWSEDM